MYESSTRSCRQDEWSELVVLVMKTSLSVAHELGLPPEAVLDCAARHLRFHDFAYFASAMQGAARAHACCSRRDIIPPVEVAYIKTLATRLEINRNVLACVPTVDAVDLRGHVGALAQTYEIVAAAIQALKEDVQHAFSVGIGAFSDAAVEGASGFARTLAAITSADDNAETFERAFAAVLHVRFAAQLHVNLGDAELQCHLDFDGHLTPVHQSYEPVGWIQRVKDAVHPNRLHNGSGGTAIFD
jgi:hypothetical protein